MAKVAKKVLYEGRVQGVGFRWTVKNVAAGYDVAGSVQNLADGRVELHAEGDAREVNAFMEGIRESGLGGHIRSEFAHDEEPRGLRGFTILH